MTVDASGVTGTPHENETTRQPSAGRKSIKVAVIVGIVLSLIFVVIATLGIGLLVGYNKGQSSSQPTLPGAGNGGGGVVATTAPVVPGIPSPTLIPQLAPKDMSTNDMNFYVYRILDDLNSVLGYAYQSRNTDWLKYYYETPGNLIGEYSYQGHAQRIDGYTGAGKVSYDRDTIQVRTYLGKTLDVEYTIHIDDITYRTRQTIVWTAVSPYDGSQMARLVNQEVKVD